MTDTETYKFLETYAYSTSTHYDTAQKTYDKLLNIRKQDYKKIYGNNKELTKYTEELMSNYAIAIMTK